MFRNGIMIAYKFFRERKDGSIGPLFIDAKQRIPLNEWMTAKDIPTKGYARRPGWHCGAEPYAPHLTEKGRVWYKIAIEDYYKFERPKYQGRYWLIAARMKVIERVGK